MKVRAPSKRLRLFAAVTLTAWIGALLCHGQALELSRIEGVSRQVSEVQFADLGLPLVAGRDLRCPVDGQRGEATRVDAAPHRALSRLPEEAAGGVAVHADVHGDGAGIRDEAAAIFDNLHMLHNNLDDVLSRPDLYPTRKEQRARILKIRDLYPHRNRWGWACAFQIQRTFGPGTMGGRGNEC